MRAGMEWTWRKAEGVATVSDARSKVVPITIVRLLRYFLTSPDLYGPAPGVHHVHP